MKGLFKMARAASGKGRGKKATKRKRKSKIAVSLKPQAGTVPYVPNTTSWDVANEIARRRRGQIAATAVQQPTLPVCPGNTPPPQQAAEAAGSVEGTGTATGVGASIAAATGAAAGTGAIVAGEGSLVADAAVITAYDQMLARLAELEATVAQLPPPPTPGIGHNNPPPDTTELEEIKRDIALLKAQPPPPPAEANNIASKFVHVAGRVLGWFGNHLNAFITEFMKASGKAAGTTAGTALGLSPLWLTFGHQLTDSAAAIMQWLMTRRGAPSLRLCCILQMAT